MTSSSARSKPDKPRQLTDGKQAEDRLRISEAEFRAAFEQSPVAKALVCAKTRHFVRVNVKFCEMTGYSVEELMGMTPENLDFPEDCDADYKLIEPLLRGEVELYDQEKRYVQKNGGIIWVRIGATMLRDSNGRPEHTMAVIQDITARKQVENALHESEDRYRAATSAVSDLIWTNNANGLMEGEQPGWGEFTGQSHEEYQGYGWSKAIHPEDAQPTIDEWNRVVAEKRKFIFEHRVRRHDGEWRVCSIRAVPILNADGEIREWVGVHTDITERKRDEKKLAQFASDLSEAHRRKDEFLATLAHELRNPLAPIRSALEILKLDGSKEPRITRARETMERQVVHMVRLIDDLLDISRISQGKLILKKSRITVKEIIDAALETSRPLIEAENHKLSILMPDYPIYLHADLTRMGQVVSNLLNNAAKYTPKLGKIEVLVQLVNQEATISITDNGKGIPFDMVPKVFEIFTQIEHTVHRAQGGLGIGLALAKTIVEMHGGTIEAKSEGVEKGSTFTLKVPVLVQSEEISVINPSRIRNLPNRIRKILIVDDNIDGAQMLSLLFQSSGHQIMTAYNGNDALTIAAKFEPDYVFLDIGLPDINGYEVLRRLRQQSEMQKTIFIALTGWGSNADKRQAAEAGFDFHLTKPVDLNELDEILQMT